MLSGDEFVRQSLELHLFFARIMKEHAFFLQISFTPKKSIYACDAEAFRRGFDMLLSDAAFLSNGLISEEVIKSGQLLTPFTLEAEMSAVYHTGVNIPINITKTENELISNTLIIDNCTGIEHKVITINNRALELIKGIANFKRIVLSEIKEGKIFTSNYPLLIDHMLREARLYFNLIYKLQRREDIDLKRQAYEQETFWNRNMAEHSKFILGFLDPVEDKLIDIAGNFGKEFDLLTEQAKKDVKDSASILKVTDDSIKLNFEVVKFKRKVTQGLLDSKVKAAMLPLVCDHTLREANHYLCLLKIFRRDM